MDTPLSWLREYVDIDCDTKEYMDKITLSGSKVEGCTYLGKDISNVVTGKVLSIEKHPDADKLVICQVDVAKEEPIQIVTGAKNLYVGAVVPVALDGATLPNGVKIKKGKLRGVVSNGMMCSVEELGCDQHDFPEAPDHGIYIFPEDQLPALGADVVDVMELRDDVVEYEITSNRPDCFSMVGIAREAAATWKKEFRYPKIAVKEEAEGDINEMISVSIENPDLCPRYIARAVKNVKIEPSPRWMRKRLKAAGVRPINNMVDITNYVMLELGQPMHAFDIDTIEDRHIIVRNAKEGEQFTTLDGQDHVLDPSMLVISDPKKAVAIAGVMGGQNSMISGHAQAVLFESANFDGPNVRITAKKLGMRTDASSKYEKGLDPNLCLDAINRAVQLVELLGAGEVVKGTVDCYPNKRTTWELPYSPEKINHLLGTQIEEEEMIEIFERLGIIVNKSERLLTIPTYRPDLQCMADLAEEVARLHGYDKIVPTLAAGTPTVGKMTYEQKIESVVKDAMIATGLCEALTFTFESPKVFDKLNVPKDSYLRNTVMISNTLGEDFSIMRTLTLHGILTSLSTNYNRRNESAGIFEIGKVFIPKSLPLSELPNEYKKLTIGMYGENIDFYHLKGTLEHLFEILGMNLKVEYSPEKEIPWMHPGRTASVAVNHQNLGYFGELHPSIAKNYEIGTRVYLAVIDMNMLCQEANMVRTYQALPKFPAVTRDISMLINEKVIVKEIEQTIRENAGRLMENLKLFDVYKGNQVLAGHKSVSYSISFRAAERTLTDDDVNPVMERIVKGLEEKFGAKLRDK